MSTSSGNKLKYQSKYNKELIKESSSSRIANTPHQSILSDEDEHPISSEE